MCGRLMPTTLTPSAGRVLVWLQSSAPPAPALYWMTVSIAGHFFFSTTCWWRADRSDSPPGGNACQYIRLAAGQADAWAKTCEGAVEPNATTTAVAAASRMRGMRSLLFDGCNLPARLPARRWRPAMKLRHLLAFGLAVAFAAPASALDLQAHRGGRGLRPENTLAAFENALRLGVTTLELDIAITAD